MFRQTFNPVWDKHELPRLESFEITDYLEHWRSDEGSKRFFHKILNVVSKLKKIIHDGDYRILEILPNEKYSLLNRFEFHSYEEQDHIDLTRKFIERGPKISELNASCFHKSGVPPPCQTLLFHSLLQSCVSFLKMLEFSGACLVQQLRLFSPLPNVILLSVHLDWNQPQPFEFFREFQLVRLPYSFQKLNEFSLGLGNSFIIQTLPQSELNREFSKFTSQRIPPAHLRLSEYWMCTWKFAPQRYFSL